MSLIWSDPKRQKAEQKVFLRMFSVKRTCYIEPGSIVDDIRGTGPGLTGKYERQLNQQV